MMYLIFFNFIGHDTSTPLNGRENLHPLSLSESPILARQPGSNMEMDINLSLTAADASLSERVREKEELGICWDIWL